MTKGFGSLRSKVERMKQGLEDDPKDEAEDILEDTKRASKREVISNDAVASTELFRSFAVEETDGTFRLFNFAPHAALVEFGTGAFFQPNPYTKGRFDAPDFSPHLVREIQAWIMMKPSFVLSGSIGAAARNIALAIAEGTENRPPGTPAQPFMRPAMFRVFGIGSNRATRRMKKSVKKAVKV